MISLPLVVSPLLVPTLFLNLYLSYFGALLLSWSYNLLASLFALSYVVGFAAMTFRWIGAVNPEINLSIFFPFEVIVPGHKKK